MKTYNDDMYEKEKNYQPGEKQFAGAMMGKANQYMERTNKHMDKAGSKIKSQAYNGNRYI